MKKLRVLIIHNYYQIPGGEDTVVENESSMLRENGHEITFYTRHNKEIDQRGILGSMGLIFETIFSVKTYMEVRKIIKRRNIDIVHVHNTLPLISPSVYYAAFSCNIPVVQTIHNFRFICPGGTLTKNNRICEDCIQEGLRCALKNKCYRKSFLHTLLITFMLIIHRTIGTYNRINGYIALTEFNKNKLLEVVKDKNKIFVKPNFAKVQNNISIPRSPENYFVYIGRLDKLKGINLLVDAWKDIKNTQLYIIGDGPERIFIDKFIQENKITNIKLCGHMERNLAFKIIAKSKAVILASQCYEGFPMTIVEAFSLGVPVICGDIGNLSFIIKDNENGLHFKYNNKNDLIAKIKILLEDEELNIRLSNGALSSFNDYYTDVSNHIKVEEIYNKIICDYNPYY